jgi:hypothetical protein
MIRLSKPVQLLEWGEGTNTLNQRWEKIGEGKIVDRTKSLLQFIGHAIQVFFKWLFLKWRPAPVGLTTLVVELDGKLTRKNSKDDAVKVVQQGEGMTPSSNQWGEVAVGRLMSIENIAGKTRVHLEIRGATKIGR